MLRPSAPLLATLPERWSVQNWLHLHTRLCPAWLSHDGTTKHISTQTLSTMQPAAQPPETEEQLEVPPAPLSPTGSGQHRPHSSGSSLEKPSTCGTASGFTTTRSPKPKNYSHFTEPKRGHVADAEDVLNAPQKPLLWWEGMDMGVWKCWWKLQGVKNSLNKTRIDKQHTLHKEIHTRSWAKTVLDGKKQKINYQEWENEQLKDLNITGVQNKALGTTSSANNTFDIWPFSQVSLSATTNSWPTVYPNNSNQF